MTCHAAALFYGKIDWRIIEGSFGNGARLEMATKRIRTNLFFAALPVSILILTALAACSTEPAPAPDTPTPLLTETTAPSGPELSNSALLGKEVFDANCALCHGADVMGTGTGPPLIDRIYEPGHHSDVSIRSAVRNGVPQHHWWFGNMPPVAGVSDAAVENLICYIRELQLTNGIFEEGAYSFSC